MFGLEKPQTPSQETELGAWIGLLGTLAPRIPQKAGIQAFMSVAMNA